MVDIRGAKWYDMARGGLEAARFFVIAKQKKEKPMGTSRCWQDNVVKGFHQRKTRTSVAERKKARRMAARKIVKELKAAGKKVDMQAINEQVLDMFRRKRQGRKPKHRI